MKIYKNVDINDLEGEVWRIIEDFPDYAVSNLGRVKRIVPDKWNHRCKILKQQKNRKGYFKVILCKNKLKYNKEIHILVFETFYNKLKSHECVHHKDENKENNYYNNFKLMTKSEHSHFHNKNKLIGENNNNSILICQDIIQIKLLLKCRKLKNKYIAKIFEVSCATVSLIKSGKVWNHIKIN